MNQSIDTLSALIHTYVDRFCAEMKNIAVEEEREKALEQACEIAEKLGVPPQEIGKLCPPVTESEMETIIYSLRKEKRFKIRKIQNLDDNILAAWDLTKYNSNSFLSIELLSDNYINLCGNTKSLFAYGHSTLEKAVRCWMDGRI